MKKYTHKNAIEAANEFIDKVNKIEQEYGIKLNSDTGDIYLSYKKENPGEGNEWHHINLHWVGDGSGIKVKDVYKDEKTLRREKALSKLTEEDKEILGIK